MSGKVAYQRLEFLCIIIQVCIVFLCFLLLLLVMLPIQSYFYKPTRTQQLINTDMPTK